MSDSNIKQIPDEKCTGCCLCNDVCPVDAISMNANEQGFIHPIIDENKCIDCGKCLALCPLNGASCTNDESPECRVIIANDEIRRNAASGGVFSAFAEIIIKRGGVVFGAAFENEFSVRHIAVDNIADLGRLKSSKYIQSNNEGVFIRVKDELDKGKEVLYSGCPCQVAALNSFLKHKGYDNLYTMDLICHGIPSPLAFAQYIKDNYGERKIDKIDFRDKSHFGWSSSMNIYFSDGEIVRKSHKEDSFFKAFLNSLSVRKSCSSCPFSAIPRQGDVTIGDFWGVSSIDPALNDKKGTSLILENNNKGKLIIEQCQALFSVNRTASLDIGKKFNRALYGTFSSHPARKRFFNNLGKISFDGLVGKCLSHHYDIGIVGLWYGLNYGSILTYFALNEVVKSMGFDALMLNKPRELWSDRYSDRNTVANKFIYKYCYTSNIRSTLEDWRALNDNCDTFIVGSDVVWNYDICGRESGQFFFLDFVNDDKKKIAMASSFGAGYNAPEKDYILSRYYLQKFDYIGVREKEGVSICKDTFGVHADQIMDPVFICDKKVYENLADSVNASNENNFVTSYILGPDNLKASVLRRISEMLDMPLKNLPNPNSPERFTEVTGLESVDDPSVEEWLYYIKNASFFVGDSFHGLCFSLIFNVPFFIVLNTNVAGLSRFTTLLKMIGLEERMMFINTEKFEDKEHIIKKEIDFDHINTILSIKADESYEWLLNAINSRKRNKGNAHDIIISELQQRVYKLEKEVRAKNA